MDTLIVPYRKNQTERPDLPKYATLGLLGLVRNKATLDGDDLVHVARGFDTFRVKQGQVATWAVG